MEQISIGDILEEVGHPQGAGFFDLLHRMATYDADRVAVVYDGREIGYGELVGSIVAAAVYLRDLGVERGDHVAFMFTAHPNALITALAVPVIGAIAVPVYAELSGEVLRSMLRRYDIKVLVVDPALASQVEGIGQHVPTLEHVILGRESEYARALQRPIGIAALDPLPDLTPASPAMIFSTSGTTGEPKGVMMPNSFAIMGYLTVRKIGVDASRVYHCGSWGHGAALTDATLAFWGGGSIVMAKRFSASRFWTELVGHGCTMVRLLGTMPRMLANQEPSELDAGHDVIDCLCAGMPADLWDEFETRFNARITEVYAATDSGGCFLVNDGTDPPGSLGRPGPEFDARIVDDDGNDVVPGQIGELLMRPRAAPAAVAYYRSPEATAEKIRDGWVWTGDHFREDAEGYYWFVDRKRDVIRRRGITIAPSSIEEIFLRHPQIGLAAAFAVPSEIGEDEIKLVVVPRSEDLTTQTVIEVAERELPRYMQPRYVELRDSVPVGEATEKLQKVVLERDWRTSTTWDVEKGAYLVSDRAGTR